MCCNLLVFGNRLYMSHRPSLWQVLHLRLGRSFPWNSDLVYFGPSCLRNPLRSKFTALTASVKLPMMTSPIAPKPTSSLKTSVKNDIFDSTPHPLLTQRHVSPLRLEIPRYSSILPPTPTQSTIFHFSSFPPSTPAQNFSPAFEALAGSHPSTDVFARWGLCIVTHSMGYCSNLHSRFQCACPSPRFNLVSAPTKGSWFGSISTCASVPTIVAEMFQHLRNLLLWSNSFNISPYSRNLSCPRIG